MTLDAERPAAPAEADEEDSEQDDQDEVPSSRPVPPKRRPRGDRPAREKGAFERRFPRQYRALRRRVRWLQKLPKRRPTLVFLAAFVWLNAMMNVRYPGREPTLWWLLPSIDVLFVMLYLAWFGALRWRVPPIGRYLLVGCLLFTRALRLGDGVQDRFFAQQFNFYTDLPLFPELVRFVYSTLTWWKLPLALAGVLAILAVVVFGSYFALVHTETYLAKRRHVYIATGIIGAMFLTGVQVGHRPHHDKLFLWGGLAGSIMPRLKHEAKFLFNVYSARSRHGQVISQISTRLREIPTNLGKLKGRNVHLILVESYGQCAHEVPTQMEILKPAFDAFERELGARGFSIVTGFLDSSTYGGQSWLAHATLATGVRTSNQLEYELVLATKPKAIAHFFREAGYRTVLVQPGTSREWPKGEFYGYEQKYFAWNFDYKGPWYAWAPMPDQYVLEFVRRKELAKPSDRPLFLWYTLVTSHAPWSDLPPVVEDWSTVGDGAIYNRLGRKRFAVEWPNFENATEAYAESLRYDFEVLRRFIADAITDDSLVILLGDHQPVWDVNGHSDLGGVPVHVLSRDPALLEPFKRLGYGAGLRKTPQGVYPGLESFLPDFLAGFSEERPHE